MQIEKNYPSSKLQTHCIRIYTLADSNENIFYVGATTQQIEKRLKEHLGAAKCYAASIKDRKIRSLHFKVFATIVDMFHVVGPCTMNAASRYTDIEQQWIAHYRSLGYDLVNAPAKKKYLPSTEDFIQKKISYENCLPQ